MSAGTLVAAILTLAVLTFLYRDNPIYKFAEYLLVGVSVGYILVITWTNSIMALLVVPLSEQGRAHLLIPFALGLLMFARFHPRTSALSRLPLALLIGSGAGVAIPAMLGPRVMRQMSDSVIPLFTASGGFDLGGLVILIGLLCTLTYFYFSRSQGGVLGTAAKTGTFFLMIFFGATFGYTVMSRMSTFIGRMEFLLSDFLHLVR